jgi:L-fuconolactonase
MGLASEAFPFVDAHVHFWDPSRLPYPWLAGAGAIAGPHLPRQLLAEAGERPPEAIVFVQAECDRARFLEEVEWVRSLGEARVARIVAFAPMDRGAATREAIARLAREPLVCGVRHNIQDDPDPALCRRPEFVDGVRRVGEAGLTFDLCLRAAQLPIVIELISDCPTTQFVLDHSAKPEIGRGALDPWRAGIDAICRFPNVVCKLSGLLTEAPPGTGVEALRPYVGHVVAGFGPDRVLFGSDWPVLNLASSYATWLEVACALVESLAPADRRAIFSATARRIYRLS